MNRFTPPLPPPPTNNRDQFTPKPGKWSITSTRDPRWNGEGEGLMLATDAAMHPNAKTHIEEKKREFGCSPPSDLVYSKRAL